VGVNDSRFGTPFVDPADERRYIAEGRWTLDETLPDLCARWARETSDRLAVVDASGAELTYAQLWTRAGALAGALIERGFRRGDVAGFQLPNRVEVPLIVLAIRLAGGVVCPMVMPYRERELSFIIAKTDMRALFVAGAFRGFDHDQLASSLRDRHPTLSVVATLGDDASATSLDRLADLEHLNAAPPQIASGDPMSVSSILFTSGTEADPKGILHTDNTMLANVRALRQLLPLVDGDGVFMASPLGHGTGYGFGIHLAAHLGAALALLDVWEPNRALELMAQHRSVYTHGATPFVQDLLSAAAAGAQIPSELQYFVTGGATVPPGGATRVRDDLDCRLLRLYGQTEGFMSSLSRLDDPMETVEQVDGRIIDGVEVRVLDEDGHEQPPGTVGECVYKGPHRCVGFLDDPERAAASMAPGQWFRSGDLVRIDADGNLAVSGRKKEVINRGGYKYSPREVEDILIDHPDVERVAVVRMADARLVDRACAFIVPSGAARPGVAELGAFLREHGIASFKWPERVVHIDRMPQTASGKIQKFVLEETLRVSGDPAADQDTTRRVTR
jgi:non-ribosomal peptide synthetase component E (peptide arylation enzyme)